MKFVALQYLKIKQSTFWLEFIYFPIQIMLTQNYLDPQHLVVKKFRMRSRMRAEWLIHHRLIRIFMLKYRGTLLVEHEIKRN